VHTYGLYSAISIFLAALVTVCRHYAADEILGIFSAREREKAAEFKSNFPAQRNFPVYSFPDDTSNVSVIQRDVVFRRRRSDAHGLTFMRTNDAKDDPPNSRRPSLQTITPVALIFSWLLFDGTTRKCIIRRWRSPTTLAAGKSALSLSLSLSLSLTDPFPIPRALSSPIWRGPLLRFSNSRRARRRGETTRYLRQTSHSPPPTHPPPPPCPPARINYEQERAGRSRSTRESRSCSVRSYEWRDRKPVLTRGARADVYHSPG